ncbi:potassium channel family protein [Rhizobium etli]|uniref:potassium channel family protein n=1 Tax=Rhizobium etli TaxID=29449 RepID=UPI00093ACE8D|nr:potassium channel family protein [Rhizobium etli]
MWRSIGALRCRLRSLYLGASPRAVRFQCVLGLIDLSIIFFFIVGPYISNPSYMLFDYILAVLLALDLIIRASISSTVRAWIVRPTTWVDVLVLSTLLFPETFSSFAFLRAFRIWSLSQSNVFKLMIYHFGLNAREDVIRACINLLTLLFLTTGFVYTTFFYQTGAGGFINALYFTVATVTTTGFGDITLPGTLGKLTSIVAMILGVSLFVRLAQAVVRPSKVSFSCDECGLLRHDADAVHCKACGQVLNIPDEGS